MTRRASTWAATDHISTSLFSLFGVIVLQRPKPGSGTAGCQWLATLQPRIRSIYRAQFPSASGNRVPGVTPARQPLGRSHTVVCYRYRSTHGRMCLLGHLHPEITCRNWSVQSWKYFTNVYLFLRWLFFVRSLFTVQLQVSVVVIGHAFAF